MKTVLSSLVALSIAFLSCSRETLIKTLVLNDSSTSQYKISMEYLLPYMDHFGIDYEVVDVNKEKPKLSPSDYALIIVGQDFEDNDAISGILNSLNKSGAGIVSFDPDLLLTSGESPGTTTEASIIIINNQHYITSLHSDTDTIQCFSPMTLRSCPSPEGEVLLHASGNPFLIASRDNNRKTVCFTSMDWMRTLVLGPLMGVDDCLWRSMVWAARKPFVMRGLPPLVTMRVDDVLGTGERWGQSPFYWVKMANKYGFKPWLGLFIYNLNPAAISELRGYLLNGDATAAPHAFGSPNRENIKTYQEAARLWKNRIYYSGLYYYDIELQPRHDYYDEFIYFDHQKLRPFSDEEAKRSLNAVDQWYDRHKPFPMSKYFLAHWYEMGSNIIDHVSQSWEMEFIGMNKETDQPWKDSVPWIRGKPFRMHEEPGTSTFNPELRGSNPLYYADFVNIKGNVFFNSLTEIRDKTGIEWFPDNNVIASAGRGIDQLRRSLSSMALAVLYTHENGYIFWDVQPDNLDAQLKLIAEGISDFSPMYITMDDALKIVRAHHTSSLSDCNSNLSEKNLNIVLEGETDTVSYANYFTEQEGRIIQNMVEIPSFQGEYTLQINDY